MLQFPVSTKMRLLSVIFMSKDPDLSPVKYKVRLPHDSNVEDLKGRISQYTGARPGDLRVYDVYKNRLWFFFGKAASLRDVRDTDSIFAFEVLSAEVAQEKVIEIPVVQNQHWPRHRGSCKYTNDLVGQPFFISLPASQATYSRICHVAEAYSRYSVDVSTRYSVDVSNTAVEITDSETARDFKAADDMKTSPGSITLGCSVHPEDASSAQGAGTDLLPDEMAGKDSRPAMDPPESEVAGLAQALSPTGYKTDGQQFLGEVSAEGQDKEELTPTDQDPGDEGLKRPDSGDGGSKSEGSGDVESTGQESNDVRPKGQTTEKITLPFELRPCDKDGVTINGMAGVTLKDKGEQPLDLTGVIYLAMDWQNSEQCRPSVLVKSKELLHQEPRSDQFQDNEVFSHPSPAAATSPGPDQPSTEVNTSLALERAMENFVHSVVRYASLGISTTVSRVRILQATQDKQFQEGLAPVQFSLTGSAFEGMPRGVCGDLDKMCILRSDPVILHCCPQGSAVQTAHITGYVIPECNRDQPAYLKLIVPESMTFQSDRVNQSIQEHGGLDYLSSYLYVNQGLPAGHEPHGPASAGLINPMKPDRGMGDNVSCLRCPSWPPCAQGFISRPRDNDWPRESLLQRIQQAGCHAVAVGHQSTERRDLEWRWSFSGAEKELIHHFNTEMASTMYLLKAIKKKQWPGDLSVGICSYYFKVACLWVAEISSSHDTTCITYTRRVLEWLIKCYTGHKLPHYFLPEQNLIGHLTEETCKQAVSALREVESHLWLHVLSSVEKDNDLPDVLASIQSKLDIGPVQQLTPDDYQKLLTFLGSSDENSDSGNIAQSLPSGIDTSAVQKPTPDDDEQLLICSTAAAGKSDSDEVLNSLPSGTNTTPAEQQTLDDIEQILKSLLRAAGKQQQPAPDDYRHFLTSLLSCKEQEDVIHELEEATNTLSPGGELYTHRDHYAVADRITADYKSMVGALKTRINTTPACDLMAIPENILLYIIDKLPTVIIKSSHVDTFTASLHRHLGDIYHFLYTYYKRHHTVTAPEIEDTCYQKSEDYFTQSVHMPYPDGWSDRGLSGYVHLAKFYFLNGEWDKVESVMAKLRPLLLAVTGSSGTINGLCAVTIGTMDPWRLLWTSDMLLYRPLVEMSTDVDVYINPTILGYYFWGRLSLRQGRRDLVEESVRYMEKAHELIRNDDQRQSAPVLIYVLKSYLTVYDELMHTDQLRFVDKYGELRGSRRLSEEEAD